MEDTKDWDNHFFTYEDLKDTYFRVVRGDRVCKNESNHRYLNTMRSEWEKDGSFYGATSAQVIEWLQKGYQQPGLNLEPPVEPIRERRRLRFAEEGELQLDLMWSGHDTPFLEWDFQEIMPGMRVDVRVNFQAGTRVEVITAYYSWVLRALVALETAGIDLEVGISTNTEGLYSNSRQKQYGFCQVKKEGQQTDFLSWSPIFCPGGFRHLMFLSYFMCAEQFGRVVQSGLGHGINMKGWDITFDHDKRTLHFNCAWSPYEFPQEEMEIKLRQVLAESRRSLV